MPLTLMRYTLMRYTLMRYTLMRYTPMRHPAHHCFGGSLAQTVVDLSRPEFQNMSFCASCAPAAASRRVGPYDRLATASGLPWTNLGSEMMSMIQRPCVSTWYPV